MISFGIPAFLPGLRPPPVAPAPPVALPISPFGLAHAFGIMLARDYPDKAYDLSDAVARGVRLGLKEGGE